MTWVTYSYLSDKVGVGKTIFVFTRKLVLSQLSLHKNFTNWVFSLEMEQCSGVDIPERWLRVNVNLLSRLEKKIIYLGNPISGKQAQNIILKPGK